MRAGKGVMAVVAIVAFVSWLPAATSAPDSQGELQALLDRWATRDGAATIEVGHEMSVFFVARPRDFLLAMSKHARRLAGVA